MFAHLQLLRQLTSARKRAEGIILGRPKGSKSKTLKLSGNENKIKQMLQKQMSISAIARTLRVHRRTVSVFVEKHHLR